MGNLHLAHYCNQSLQIQSWPFMRRIAPYSFILFLSISCAQRHTTQLDQPDKSIQAKAGGPAQHLELPLQRLMSSTAVYSLENGGKSLFARLWLIDHAERSIDMQYYSFAKDITGTIVWEHLLRAADRGVKIRIILDDAASRSYGKHIQLMDSHENIEIRIYNGGLKLGRAHRRMWQLAKNSNRLLRRMHNKTFNVDGRFTIIGGRNIADEYFDYHEKYNFRDRDLLLMGKEAETIERSFTAFWGHELSKAYAEIGGKQRKKVSTDPARFEKFHHKAEEMKEFTTQSRSRIDSFAMEIIHAQQTDALHWVKAISYVSDAPGKRAGTGDSKNSVCMDSITALIRSAKTSIDIQSPYVITTEKERELLREATARGVKIRLLTNSLASIDNYEPFAGYQKDRERLMDEGVLIREFRPDAEERFKLMIPDRQTVLKYKPVYGLHSKTILIDGRISIVGSYNFDPRSQEYNTECIAIIRSEAVNKNISGFVEEEFKVANSWTTEKNRNNDHKASAIKRMKARFWWLLPKKLS